MLPSRYFIELTQPEIAAQLKANPLVILPAGSVEQHGPHLPTGTDTFAANVISAAVAERMDGLVLPATPFGVTPMHMPFEGTITFTPDTYMRVVTETCVSTAKHGAKRLLILNWHEGNIPSLAIAAESLHRDHGMSVLTVQACYVAEELYGKTCNGLTHGGEIEALAVLAFRPELVHLDRIDYSSDHSHGHKWDKLRRTRSYQPVLTDIRTIAATGWFGSPQHATAEKGARMLTDIADAIAREAADIFRQLDAVQGGTAEIKQLRQAVKGRPMARLLKQGEGKRLGLPGRAALEMVSGEIGSKLTFRVVEMPVQKPGDTLRGPHLHHGYEECIYVLKGEGRTLSESGELSIKAGDVVLVPPEEKHVTRNTGSRAARSALLLPDAGHRRLDRKLPRLLIHPRIEKLMSTDVLCLRPEADFTRVDAPAPATLRVTYRKPDDADVPTLMRAADALIIPAVGPKLAPTLFEGGRLKLVQITGAGVDRLDREALDAARHSGRQRGRRQQRRGRRICGDRRLGAAAPLCLGRRRNQGGNYAAFRARMVADNLAGLDGLLVGLVGFGAIGMAVAQAFAALGCRVCYTIRRRATPKRLRRSAPSRWRSTRCSPPPTWSACTCRCCRRRRG